MANETHMGPEVRETRDTTLPVAGSSTIPETKPGGISPLGNAKSNPRPRRLVVGIESVYYYRTNAGLNCAVLINTQFDLDGKDRLAFAKLPLRAFDPADTGEKADISSHYPLGEEQYKLQELSTSHAIHATPSLNVGAMGASVGIGGMGVDKHSKGTLPCFISLHPVMDERANCPATLNWKFADKNGIHYPSQLKLLVVASKETDDPRETWFPFELRIDWNLVVDLHDRNGILDRVLRLVARINKHDGWCFKIKGKHRQDLAHNALENAQRARNSQDHEVVGLYPAMRAWREANEIFRSTAKIDSDTPMKST